jgi:hypothetical protein
MNASELALHPINILKQVADSMIRNKDIARGASGFLSNDTMFPEQLRDADTMAGREFHVKLINLVKPTQIYYDLITGTLALQSEWAPGTNNEKYYYVAIIMAAQKAESEMARLFPNRRKALRKTRKTRKSKNTRRNK